MAQRTTGIVGGGIVGLAVARELIRRRPGHRVVVLEKEDHLAAHQTGHNSGVVHAGIYYRPGSLKAQLCTRGRDLLREYCAEHEIAYNPCGKVVVAVEESELDRLDALEASATANGVPGLTRLGPAGIREVEPHAQGLAALHSPQTAIVDYVAVARALAEDIRGEGGEVRLSSPVTGVRRLPGGVEIAVEGQDPLVVDELVVCAGLHADRLAQHVDGRPGPRIIPFRGEYLEVAPAKAGLVRGMVYPVPDPRYPFLGVHFTRRVTGGLEIGPNAVLALSREGYGWHRVSLRDLAETVRWPGFWQLAARHWRTGVTEVVGSISVGAYLRQAQRYVPEIEAADVRRGLTGVRAQAIERDGTLVDDFVITGGDGVTCVRNAPSPAATSSLAIAEHVVDRMAKG